MTTDKFYDKNDSQRICYREYGQGVPLILIAGLGLQQPIGPPHLLSRSLITDTGSLRRIIVMPAALFIATIYLL